VVVVFGLPPDGGQFDAGLNSLQQVQRVQQQANAWFHLHAGLALPSRQANHLMAPQLQHQRASTTFPSLQLPARPANAAGDTAEQSVFALGCAEHQPALAWSACTH
jgi:hypothetical protein